MKRLGFSTLGSAAGAIVAVVLACATGMPEVRAADGEAPIRALLVCGGCCHDYAHQKDILTKGISERANVVWTIAYDPVATREHKNPVYDSADWAKGFDVIVHDECSGSIKDVDFVQRILKPHRDGLPAVVLHCGMHTYRAAGLPGIPPWQEFTGLQTVEHGPLAPIEIRFVDEQSPITKGLENWTTINEELYINKIGKLFSTGHALARGKQRVKDKSGKERTSDQIVAWTNVYNGKARVFATTIGHNNKTVADPRYLDLVTRGLLWSVDKLDDAHLKSSGKTPSGKQSKP